jgi:hypothetical protein
MIFSNLEISLLIDVVPFKHHEEMFIPYNFMF